MTKPIKNRLRYFCIVCGIIIYVILPFGLNYLISRPIPYNIDVVGTKETWLNFWAIYLGLAIPIIVLVFTLKNTIKQNRLTLLYSSENNWVSQLKTSIILVEQTFSQLDLDYLYLKICSNNSEEEIMILHSSLASKINNATQSMRVILLGKNDEIEQKYLKYFEDMRIIYCAKLHDLIWFSQFLRNNPQADISTYKKSLELYSNTWNEDGIDDIRLYNISKRYNFEYKDKSSEILKELSACPEIGLLLHETSENFIRHEITKTANILYGTK